MLPEWDFGGDEAKRRTFIGWVWQELDRFAVMVTATPVAIKQDWAALLRSGAKGSVGRPGGALDSVNGMVWDYLLTRYMFGRYWPGKRRREDDQASALNIAIHRSLHHPAGSRPNDLERLDAEHEARDSLTAELKRGLLSVSTGRGKPRVKSLGRVQAEADIQLLDSLPPHRFAL